ncbi:SGNH/GDSL hydrolase family protein [Nitrosospira lacus]|uniref:SGNH/GDSL hydrolase family protein n=1 Tax=Nitrosospira lacus TaxID=1288494 RepID=UPI0002C52A06|nr:SGNH/GDSL hydrolase family protein [Nitrosospira lacus]
MKTQAFFAASFALLLTGGNVGAAPFSGLYAFGDSLSDAGNSQYAELSLYKRLLDNCFFPCPPYADGRVSNGKVATEYLADALFPGAVSSGTANFRSYAVAGATSGIGNSGDGGTAIEKGNLLPGPIPIPVPGILPLPGMNHEVGQYISDSNRSADPNALYFLWGGANDYLSHKDLTTVEASQLAAQNIAGYVSVLAGAGARNFLIPNLPDLSTTPSVAALGDPAKADAHMFSIVFNNELASQLGNVSSQFPDANIFQFDTYTFVNGILANPSDPHYNLTDVQNACLTASGSCANPDGFLYWDDFHPTTRGHAILASAFASAVPEPEMMTMFLAGLFVVGMGCNRRRKLRYAV